MSAMPTSTAPATDSSPSPAPIPGLAGTPAPGYSGVTSNGYGYTGYTSPSVPSPTPGPYRAVLAPTPAPSGSVYDRLVATSLTLPVAPPTTSDIIDSQTRSDGDGLYATTPERIRQDEARMQLFLELKTENPDFDGSREAWLVAELESQGGVQRRYNDLLAALEGASRVLNRIPIYDPYDVTPAPMPLMLQRPAPPP
jgi:hypothetical protein